MAQTLLPTDRVTACDLEESCPIESDKLASSVLIQSNGLKQIIFCLDGGQLLNDHQTPNVAIVQILSGTMTVTVGDEEYILGEQEVVVIPPRQTHAVHALVPTRFLLTLVKETGE